ncbi:hypothetical protein NQ314_002112 [Rhamnusium bicolor]|uniref:Uncharacterized protein n=1 Tax=Rhamnusium bicolor TaxID=1586634 RepID=A0AAV8ZT49_9CUCU|nr:hypothetical protein NQ314_002112 [Rhamnusium bicolor]
MNGPLLDGCRDPQYKKVSTKSCTLSCNTIANKFVELKNGDVFEIKNFCFNENNFVMLGFVYDKIGDLFVKPCRSSELDINVIKPKISLKCVPFNQFYRKLVVLRYNESDKEYVSFPMLHFK